MKKIFALLFCMYLFFDYNVYAQENMNLNADLKEEVKDELLNNDSSNLENEDEKNEVYDIQKVRVVITKVVKDGDETHSLVGAVLQIIDSNNVVVDEWTSDGNEHVILLPKGNYVIHEVEAPSGYTLSEDIPISIDIKINSINAGTDVDPYPCDHYGNGIDKGVVLYYVEIDGVKYEVYCINQFLGTPDENSIYDGTILDSNNIKNYTMQEVYIDAHYGTEIKDVSDPSLNSEELYDKFLDIIYHRHLAVNEFPDLTESEIRYITESALKNYSNTSLMEIQRVLKNNVPAHYDKYNSYETTDGKYIWYIYPMYKSFVYLKDAPLGESVYKTVVGGDEANSFGNIARHWNDGHNAKNSQEARDKLAKYYELYNFLISDDNPHPDNMNLYIYSSDSIHNYEYNGNEYEEPYQSLLGVTGFFETFKEEEKKIEVVNTYSDEKTEATVKKIWNDFNNQDGIRPDSITVTLNTGESAVLNDENNWSATIKDLPKYVKGEEIEYKWVEEKLPNGYELTDTSVNETVTTLTNTHIPSLIDEKNNIINPKTADNINFYIITLVVSILLFFRGKAYLKK